MSVQNNGPLWAFSCFFYEDLNGDLRSLFHGTQNVESQIIKAVSIMQHLPELQESLPISPVKAFCGTLMTRKEPGHETEHIKKEKKLSVVGAVKIGLPVCQEEREKLENANGRKLEEETTGKFFRLKIGKQIIHSKEYSRVTRRHTATVAFEDFGEVQYGTIRYFVKCRARCSSSSCLEAKVCSCTRNNYFEVVKKFEKDTDRVLSSSDLSGPVAIIGHLIAVKSDNRQLKCIHVDKILYSCFLIDTGGTSLYLGVAPNAIERF